MSLIVHHTSDEICMYCENKISQCDPRIADWFRWAKGLHPDIHCSWGFRGEADQNEAIATGHSEKPWPLSPHNRTDADGKPCSIAVDIFQIDDSGKGVWDNGFCAYLNTESSIHGYRLKWGGYWKSLGDSCHWQIGD